MIEPALAAVVTIFFGSLFAGLSLLARAVPRATYRKITMGLAYGPAGIWAALGLITDAPVTILSMAAGLAIAVLVLARLAAWTVGR